jgi:sialic acid synthase SpsE
MPDVTIAGRRIGEGQPTYFIADIAANHDGDLSRAKDLIYLAAEAGAEVAKFQHFAAATIVSDYGFRALGTQQSHQARWGKSVYEVYVDASVNPDWTPVLKATCEEAGITFMTSPYSFELVDAVDPCVPAYKIGSGDISWHGLIEHIARKGKPILIACGASSLDDVVAAMDVVHAHTRDVVLLQCNTNYTASVDNFRYINLRVLETLRVMYPDVVLGLSDHTPGHATVLGAVALGARVVEKHFTDDRSRVGPDHGFSMDPQTWRDMVERTRELELALGTGIKRIEDNEQQTVILQRRAIRAARPIARGEQICPDSLEVLRPCPPDALPPFRLREVVGRTAARAILPGEHLRWTDLQ